MVSYSFLLVLNFFLLLNNNRLATKTKLSKTQLESLAPHTAHGHKISQWCSDDPGTEKWSTHDYRDPTGDVWDQDGTSVEEHQILSVYHVLTDMGKAKIIAMEE